MKSPESPFFTVIIPTRNRPKDFKIALDSIIGQSFKDIEVIAVNDGTNKEHRCAYDKLEAGSPVNVRYLNLTERSRGHGHCFARNEGVTASSGKYICFLDDDDLWTDSEFLQRAKSEIEKMQCDLYIANQKAITHDGMEIKNVWVEDIPSLLEQSDTRFNQSIFKIEARELLKSRGFAHQNTCIVSRSLFDQVEGMDENMRYEPDRDIYLRLLDNANMILYDTNVVAQHNVPDKTKSTNASTKTNKLQKLLFQLRTANKGLMFSKKHEVFLFCKQFKAHTLKHITTELLQQNDIQKAVIYSKQALAVKFGLKWFVFTQYLKLRSLLEKK